jgi:hypothetical protein
MRSIVPHGRPDSLDDGVGADPGRVHQFRGGPRGGQVAHGQVDRSQRLVGERVEDAQDTASLG